ncbi:MAG: hypothetical protein JW982_08755 [Spirochaetes bacterium]|nr:hypothetical protein [Spirochaetota bacterium]
MKKGLLIIILFILSSCSSIQKTAAINSDFATPEAAIKYFIAGIAKNDLNYALQACAIKEAADNFSFKKFTERLNALIFWSSMAPSEYPFYADINRADRISFISRQIKFFCFSMLSAEKDYSLTVPEPSEERINDFIRSSDPSKLADLRIIKITVPYPDLIESERNQRNWKLQAAIYGAETKTERIVLYELNGKFFTGGISLLKYGSNWKIESLSSSLANTSPMGSVEEVYINGMEAEYLEGLGF